MFTVAFSEEALEDLDIALEYYRNISLALCEKFIKNFDETTLQLENIPYFQIEMTKCVCEK